jgi:hypothetical protein
MPPPNAEIGMADEEVKSGAAPSGTGRREEAAAIPQDGGCNGQDPRISGLR